MKRAAPEGFVLIAVLWFVALLALLAVVVQGWIGAALGQALALHQRVAARIAAMDAASRIEFALTSGPLSVRGLELSGDRAARHADAGAIALDGRAYRVAGAVVRVQDEAGLWNLNEGDEFILPRMLGTYGIGYGRAGALLARLHDYITPPDPDGAADAAEGADYARADLPPPRHAPLLTPWEAYRVLGWDRQTALWQGAAALPELSAVGRFAGINVNTAAPAVLATVPGLDAAAIAQLVAARERQPLADAASLEQATGIVVADPDLTYSPANSVRLDILPDGDRLRHTLVIRLTPLGPAPYRIDYAVELPRTDADRALARSPDLPGLPGSDAGGE